MSNTQQVENAIKESILKNALEPLKKLSNYHFELGVFTTTSSRKVKIGVTNAELMFIHENGSPTRHIPSRPVLQMTIEYSIKKILPKAIENCALIVLRYGFDETRIENELNKFAERIQKYARRIIYSNDGRLAKNAPSTIARKKNTNHPLFDTGQLARSITCRVVKD